jgi:hypothetical protein
MTYGRYMAIHRLETNKLRNVAKFFSHLLHSDAMSWNVLEYCLGMLVVSIGIFITGTDARRYIRLSEEETTSASRIFIKILFQQVPPSRAPHSAAEHSRDTVYIAPLVPLPAFCAHADTSLCYLCTTGSRHSDRAAPPCPGAQRNVRWGVFVNSCLSISA